MIGLKGLEWLFGCYAWTLFHYVLTFVYVNVDNWFSVIWSNWSVYFTVWIYVANPMYADMHECVLCWSAKLFRLVYYVKVFHEWTLVGHVYRFLHTPGCIYIVWVYLSVDALCLCRVGVSEVQYFWVFSTARTQCYFILWPWWYACIASALVRCLCCGMFYSLIPCREGAFEVKDQRYQCCAEVSAVAQVCVCIEFLWLSQDRRLYLKFGSWLSPHRTRPAWECWNLILHYPVLVLRYPEISYTGRMWPGILGCRMCGLLMECSMTKGSWNPPCWAGCPWLKHITNGIHTPST